MLEVLGVRNFVLLWIGQGASLVGDSFHFIALPWLVLQLTGDAFALGSVLALGGIPRALFMLLGGAITDRFSARSIITLLQRRTPQELMGRIWPYAAAPARTHASSFCQIPRHINNDNALFPAQE